ncbi:Proteasome endopeptidase complex [Forsythia ovata]|uniref:Proteasome endopeptidase complex n=1 Tax=Forsythia ovata TaxID=205694 RepID=A0ABD1SNT9_9LAMI
MGIPWIMYNRRNKFNPLWNSLALGGVKNGQNYLGTKEYEGLHRRRKPEEGLRRRSQKEAAHQFTMPFNQKRVYIYGFSVTLKSTVIISPRVTIRRKPQLQRFA